jgi:hypothetical protein
MLDTGWTLLFLNLRLYALSPTDDRFFIVGRNDDAHLRQTAESPRMAQSS